MKRLSFLFILLSALSFQAMSQAINRAEYFFDTDPGVGNGLPLTVSLAGDTIDETFNISVISLSEGAHLLYIRTENAVGKWSFQEPRAFQITPSAPANFTVVSAEYFFDNDPGIGNGIALSSFTGADSIDISTTISTTGLPAGLHKLYIRTKDVNGHYSLHEPRSFNIYGAPVNEQIVAAEYFFDTDPGVGNGTAIATGTSADSIDVLDHITVPSLSLGTHYLYIRTKNADGRWSLHDTRNMNVCSTYGADANFSVDVIGGVAYFHDASQYVASRKWMFGDGQEDTVQVNPRHSYATGGIYNACLLAKSACGNDTDCITVYVNGIQAIQPTYASDSSFISVKVTGYGFQPGSKIKLVRSGFPDIIADTTIYINTTELKVNILFSGAAIGFWDVVVINPTNGSDTLENGFEIQPVRPFDPWIQILGPRKTLVNTSTRIRIAFGNNGNVTAFAVPLYIRVSGDRSPILLTAVDTTTMPKSLRDTLGFPSTHFYIRKDTLSGDSAMMAAVIVPVMEPGITRYVDITVFSPIIGNYFVEAKFLQPLFNDAQLDTLGLKETSCNFLPVCYQCLLDLAGLTPAACVVGMSSLGCSIGGTIAGYGQQTVVDIGTNIAGQLLSCTTLNLSSLALVAAQGLTDMASSSVGAYQSCVGQGGCGPSGPKGWKQFPSAASLDPNIKDGPTGINSQNYISGNDPMEYRVFFENVDTATAPAREVLIIDTLDTSVLDLTRFHFTGFGFGDSLYYLDVERDFFSTDIDMRPAKNIILRVSGHLDRNSGIVTARYSSFDPVTMALTDSVDDGFLPPNIARPEGEGFVSYSVKPIAGLPHLTQINNGAQIIFDNNAPINTPVWLNTVDRQKPQSAVNVLPLNQVDTIFTISWGGSDPHAGVMDYSIYVSDNDSAYYVYLYGVSYTSTKFFGKPGHKYKFYSIARDYVMNVEDAPGAEDAVTNTPPVGINELSPSSAFWMKQNIPNPFSDKSYVEFSLPSNMNVSLTVTDLLGRNIMTVFEEKLSKGVHTAEINADRISNGIYFLKLATREKTFTRKMMVLKR